MFQSSFIDFYKNFCAHTHTFFEQKFPMLVAVQSAGNRLAVPSTCVRASGRGATLGYWAQE